MSLPEPFIQSIKTVPGFNEETFREIHLSNRALTSIRFNPEKFNIQHSTFNIEERVPWSSNGFYLNIRPSFTLDPLFHAGAYYVQEASSMFLEEAIRQTCDLSKPLNVLDLCAAPGGKSTLIQSIISEDSLLVSNEVIKSRANILAENITKWGAANVVVTNNDPKDFKKIPAFFDLVVVDAPCSGSGLFRKDPAAITEWSLNNVNLCSDRQQRILADIMDSLKPGGVLIYSTCSYSIEEDEAIVDWLIEKNKLESIAFKLEENWGIVETISAKEKNFGYRFYPDKLKGEGFFIAGFRKAEGPSDSKEIKLRNKAVFLSKTEMEIVSKYILHSEKYSFFKWNDDVLLCPSAIFDKLLLLQAVLYLKKAGVNMGTIIRNELIPNHEWAVSCMASAFIPKLEVDLENALQYLRRQDMKIVTDTKGWAIIVYHQLPLGLVKIMPGRINNYYPKEWRILNK